MSLQRREKQPLAAEDHRPEIPGALDFITHVAGKSDPVRALSKILRWTTLWEIEATDAAREATWQTGTGSPEERRDSRLKLAAKGRPPAGRAERLLPAPVL